MPWSSGDVEKHKKGLSDKQKERWVATANSVLKDCMAKGGSESECAGKAIRIANGVSDNEQQYYVTVQQGQAYAVQRKRHNGRDHLIVPVVMMVEGVHNGSHGPLLHEIAELGKFPEAWNGIPIVINHPEYDGMNISANDPDIVDQVVGTVYHTTVKDNKLTAEAWLDEMKLQEISLEAYNHIHKGEPIEVSLGMYTEDEIVTGEWQGEPYDAVAKNHRPDHLALLPASVGACSVADGCGIRANEEQGDEEITDDEQVTGMEKKRKDLGMSVSEFYAVPKDPPSESKLPIFDAAHVRNAMARFSQTQGLSSEERASARRKIIAKAHHFKIDTSGFEDVKSNVKYFKKEEKKMAENAKECAPCVKKKVDELIANSQGKYTEDDREILETLNEELLDKMAKPIEKEVIKEVEKKIEVNKLTPEDQAALEFGKRQLRERREGWIKKILDNTQNVWTDAELKGLPDGHLEKVANSVKKEEVVDYSLNTGFNTNVSASAVDPLYPAGVEIDKDK